MEYGFVLFAWPGLNRQALAGPTNLGILSTITKDLITGTIFNPLAIIGPSNGPILCENR